MIELLVVVAIIVLLVSILVPSLTTARQITYETVCQSNLRQLSTGMLMYTQDSRDCLPGNGYIGNADWLGTNNDPLPGYRDSYDSMPMNGTLYKYVKSPKVYICPIYERVGDASPHKPLGRKHSYTSPGILAGSPTNKIRSCLIEQNPRSADGNWRQANLSIMAPVFIEESAEWSMERVNDSGWTNDDGVTSRHRGKGFLGIIDGHVEGYPFSQGDRTRKRMTAKHLFYAMTDGRKVSARYFICPVENIPHKYWIDWNCLAHIPGEP